MDDRAFSQVRRIIRRHLLPRRHTALLVAIVTAFAVRPLIGDIGIAPAVFSIAILVLLLVALYTVQVDELLGEREVLLAETKRRHTVGWVLALAAAAGRVATVFAPAYTLYLIGLLCWLLFFSFITWSELRAVLRQKVITSETISMSISVYLLMGMTWAFLYNLIYQIHPHAFSLGNSTTSLAGSAYNQESTVFPVLLYFSLTTLATIGYGDITPVSLQARYVAVAEGITGQFYLAVLVARLVGVYVSHSATPQAEQSMSNSEGKASA